jgi:hypothetical protein
VQNGSELTGPSVTSHLREATVLCKWLSCQPSCNVQPHIAIGIDVPQPAGTSTALKGVLKDKAMKCLWTLLSLALLASAGFAKAKEPLKIEVVSTDSREYKYQGGGLIGIAVGSRTKNEVFAMNTIVNGEHVKLNCQENHGGCTAMTPGVYDAEFDRKSVWITSVKPLTHKTVREHWKLSGGW